MLFTRKNQAKRDEPDEKLSHPVGSYERCVRCGKLTGVSKFAPIRERACYLPTAGQLCEDCCYELYGTTDLRTMSTIM